MAQTLGDIMAPPVAGSYKPTGAQKRTLADYLRELELGNVLNGTGVPERAAALNELLNPLAAIPRAQQAAGQMLAPDRTGLERVGNLGQMLGEVAGVVAPMAGAAYVGKPAINALAEGLTGVQTTAGNALAGAGDVGRQFYVDESGALRVWHGSPHDFDRFSLDKIGTGEGAQAYGHGLYFAESPDVAQSYKTALEPNLKIGNEYYRSDDPVLPTVISNTLVENGISNEVADMVAGFVKRQNPLETPLSIVDRNHPEIAQKVRDLLKAETKDGRLYEAAIDANPEDFLDWDAPITQQPKAVQDLAQTMDLSLAKGATRGMIQAWREGREVGALPTGADIDRALSGYGANRPKATDALRAVGIKGVQYFDRGSRVADGGTRNYVVFDDRIVNILGKDGQRTTPEGKAQTILDMLQSGRANEVTDEMLDLGDPVANARLNQYLYRNYDLPMDEASRMQRAGEMGFDTGTPLYHGTEGDFQSIKPSNKGAQGKGVYTTHSPDAAADYAGQWGGDASVLPLATRGNYTHNSMSDPYFRVNEGDFGIEMDYGARVDRVIQDPRNIRSRFARFDPRLSHLKNLSAGIAGVGFGGAALAPQDAQALGVILSQNETEKRKLRDYLEGIQ